MDRQLINFLAYLIRNRESEVVTRALRCGAVQPAEVLAATKEAKRVSGAYTTSPA